MLTRKDFIKKADEFINMYKRYEEKINHILVINNAVKGYCEFAKKSNERFDEQRFRDYIEVGIYGNKI